MTAGNEPRSTNAQVARSDHDLLIVMNTKLDVALSQLNDHQQQIRELSARPVGNPEVSARVDQHALRLDEHARQLVDHETRIRRAEVLLWRAAGAAAAGAGLAGFGLDHFVK